MVGGFGPVNRFQGIVLVDRLDRVRLFDRVHWIFLLGLLDRLGRLSVLGSLLEVTVVDPVQSGVPVDNGERAW